MAVPCDREPSPRPRLVREALTPLPPSVRRPFTLIGASVALVFLAAVFDAVLWRYSMERDELRTRAVQAEQRVVDLESRLHGAQIQLVKQEIKLADTDDARAAARRRLYDLTHVASPCREPAQVVPAQRVDGPPTISTPAPGSPMASGRTGKR
jgi:hypothetical protein